MQGTYYLSSTINLGPDNSGLTFSAYNGEAVEINGGIPLTTKWVPYNTSIYPEISFNFTLRTIVDSIKYIRMQIMYGVEQFLKEILPE